MKIDATPRVVDLDEKTSRLVITIEVDGEFIGSEVVLSGPRRDVYDFAEGKLTLAEIRQAWAKKR